MTADAAFLPTTSRLRVAAIGAMPKLTCDGQLEVKRPTRKRSHGNVRTQPIVEIRAQAFLRVIALEGKLRQRRTQ